MLAGVPHRDFQDLSIIYRWVIKMDDNGIQSTLIKNSLAEQLGVNKDDIKPESRFKEDLNADSLDLFELIMSLEEEYSTEIPTDELENLTTIQSVIDYLGAKGIA